LPVNTDVQVFGIDSRDLHFEGDLVLIFVNVGGRCEFGWWLKLRQVGPATRAVAGRDGSFDLQSI
jgi:hypothetical protein